MSIAYAMVAKHLMKVKTVFECGIPHMFSDQAKVEELKALVKKCATQLDYTMPTFGMAHLRLNTIIKEFTNKESWQYGGGVLISGDVDAQIEAACQRALDANPGKAIKSKTLTCGIINEWERYSVVFELVIEVGAE